MKHWQRLLFLLCLFTTSSLSAQTYYFANAGNDANDGLTPQTAWQTLSKLDGQRFADGDSFLFKRGDIFRGSVRLGGSPTGLTFSVYGEGENPVFSGSVVISNWKPTSHSALNKKVVYEADVSGLLPQDADGKVRPIQHLFVNGKLMTIARYPNVASPLDKNWLKVGGGGSGYFTDPELAAYGKPNNYWKGATLRIRNYSWTYTAREITGYSASNGKVTVPDLKDQLAEWGYFIDGKLEELDFPYEWYYDANSQKVYLYLPEGDPNQFLVEGAVYTTGISIFYQQHDALIENLQFRHFMTQGVHVNNSNNVRVQNCYFYHNLKGVTIWNTADLSVSYNQFHSQLHSAIVLQSDVKNNFDVKGSIIENNIIMNHALYRAYGMRYDGVYQGNAIDVYGKAFTVRGNYIENVGENGMYLHDGGHHLIENNVIKNALLILNDGGAISINSSGNIIRGNFLSGSVGNIDESNGCASSQRDPCTHHTAYGMGVAADSKFENNTIENNVVFNNRDMGIRLNSFKNSTVRNNIVYNNDPQIVVQDIRAPSSGNVVENNTVISLHPDQLGLELTNETNHGTMKNNYYCNPYSDLAVMRDGERYSVAHWKQTFSQYGQNSRDCGLLEPSEITAPIGENVISNSTFDTDIKGWSNTSQFSHDPTKLDSGSLKVVFDGSNLLTLAPSSTVNLQKDQWYRLTFSVIADGYGDIRLRLNQTKPKHVVYEQRYFAMDTKRRDYQYVFQGQLTDDSMKFLLNTDKNDSKTYWIDNFKFEPVAFQPSLPAEERIKLFTNPTFETRTINLQGLEYVDLNGKAVTGQISLKPFTAAVLIRKDTKINAPAQLAAPTLYLDVRQNELTLKWTAVLGAYGYWLYYAPYPNAESVQRVDMQLGRQLVLQLEPGFAGYIAVVPYNAQGAFGEISNIEQFVLH